MGRRQFNVMSRTGLVNYNIFMLRLLKPVPGKAMDAWMPDSRVLSVSCSGPSWIVLVNDLMPFSVILNPAIVLSKLKADLGLVI
jgi:hypothetical protein